MTLAIVSPCFNEEAVLHESSKRITAVLDSLVQKGKIADGSFVLYVNDGSTDRTWQVIKQLAAGNSLIKGISLGANSGHQNAIMAGMMTAKDFSDAVITIDADLQDDINAIEEMVDAYAEGYDVVYGVKTSRKADPVMKRLTAAAFYKLQQNMGMKTVYNHADFRLMSKRAIDQLACYDERNLYLRGIIPSLGFPSTTVKDEIKPREAGESKYTFSKMLSLALDGITSLSIRPIYWILYLGLAYMVVSVFIGLYVAWSIIFGEVERGWSSLILSIWIVGGSILIALGIIGLYVGKTFMETKRRPRYNITDSIGTK